MSGSPVKTEGVDISPEAVAAYLSGKLSGRSITHGWALVEALRTALTAEAKRLDWLERNHTLHNSVAILYVVDGYEVQFSTQDGNNLVAETHGGTLRDAIDKCMEEVP